MKRLSWITILSLLVILGACGPKNGTGSEGQSTDNSTSETDSELEGKIDEIMAKMSVKAKVGQMTQVNLNTILVPKNGTGYNNNDGIISPALLDTAVNTYQVGSILNAINHAYPQEQWHGIIKTIQDAAMKNDPQIPVIYGIDAIHGTTFTQKSTLFPHNIGVAASRNPQVAKNAAKVTANEVRASGIRWNFDPVFDIGRMPLWPRFPETFGEDPHLIEKMGVATIEGYEEDGLENTTAVASCMKHFVGYSGSRTGRDRTPSYIPEIELREYYLPQFKAAIDAGSSTIMINSGEVNGIPVHGSKYLLTTILRDELGFKGLVVTDWEDINRLHERHNICPTMKEAVRVGVLAGIDMSMTPHDFKFAVLLAELYEEDKEVAARVDESVRRILRLKLQLGLFDNAYVEEEAIANFGKEEYSEVALDAARQSMTLLKNDEGILPLNKEQKVLLVGPNANSVASLHGCWSYTWQGADEQLKWEHIETGEEVVLNTYPETTLTIKEAFENKIGAGNVICRSQSDYEASVNYDAAKLKADARSADVVVLCLGENAYAESPGSIRDLTMDARQIALAKAAAATGKPVVLVLVEGRPRTISSFVDQIPGVLMAYWPGSQGANAIADVVFGDYNPAGKLPYSYPRFTGDFVTYDHHWTEMNIEQSPGSFTDTGYNPQWMFGHGLSYTTFEYSDFTLDKSELVGTDKLTVSVKVTNTGDVDGEEAVELYIRDMYASSVPANRRLKAFERVAIAAGESKTVTFELDHKDLAIAVQDPETGKYERKAEDGEFKVFLSGFGFELEQPDKPWLAFLNRSYTNGKSFTYKSK